MIATRKYGENSGNIAADTCDIVADAYPAIFKVYIVMNIRNKIWPPYRPSISSAINSVTGILQ